MRDCQYALTASGGLLGLIDCAPTVGAQAEYQSTMQRMALESCTSHYLLASPLRGRIIPQVVGSRIL